MGYKGLSRALLRTIAHMIYMFSERKLSKPAPKACFEKSLDESVIMTLLLIIMVLGAVVPIGLERKCQADFLKEKINIMSLDS